MKREEFRSSMQRLIEQWGKTTYSEVRIEFIWKAIQHQDASHWEQAVEKLITSNRQAPLLPEILDELSALKQRQYEMERANRKSEDSWDKLYFDCHVCKDTGVYVCLHKKKPGFWAFRCHCEKGCNDVRKHIPQFKNEHLEEYIYFDAKMGMPQMRSMGHE